MSHTKVLSLADKVLFLPTRGERDNGSHELQWGASIILPILYHWPTNPSLTQSCFCGSDFYWLDWKLASAYWNIDLFECKLLWTTHQLWRGCDLLACMSLAGACGLRCPFYLHRRLFHPLTTSFDDYARWQGNFDVELVFLSKFCRTRYTLGSRNPPRSLRNPAWGPLNPRAYGHKSKLISLSYSSGPYKLFSLWSGLSYNYPVSRPRQQKELERSSYWEACSQWCSIHNEGKKNAPITALPTRWDEKPNEQVAHEVLNNANNEGNTWHNVTWAQREPQGQEPRKHR